MAGEGRKNSLKKPAKTGSKFKYKKVNLLIYRIQLPIVICICCINIDIGCGDFS